MIISTTLFIVSLVTSASTGALIATIVSASAKKDELPLLSYNFVDVSPCTMCDYDDADIAAHPLLGGVVRL
jgi:hypothetical protein